MSDIICSGTNASGAFEAQLPTAKNHYKSICVCVPTQWEGQRCMFAPSTYKTSGCCITCTHQRGKALRDAACYCFYMMSCRPDIQLGKFNVMNSVISFIYARDTNTVCASVLICFFIRPTAV